MIRSSVIHHPNIKIVRRKLVLVRSRLQQKLLVIDGIPIDSYCLSNTHNPVLGPSALLFYQPSLQKRRRQTVLALRIESKVHSMPNVHPHPKGEARLVIPRKRSNNIGVIESSEGCAIQNVVVLLLGVYFVPRDNVPSHKLEIGREAANCDGMAITIP